MTAVHTVIIAVACAAAVAYSAVVATIAISARVAAVIWMTGACAAVRASSAVAASVAGAIAVSIAVSTAIADSLIDHEFRGESKCVREAFGFKDHADFVFSDIVFVAGLHNPDDGLSLNVSSSVDEVGKISGALAGFQGSESDFECATFIGEVNIETKVVEGVFFNCS